MLIKKGTRRLKQKKTFSARTEVRFLRISPRKLRLVAETIKKLSPQQAILRLRVWNKKGARLLLKAVKTVVADAENNFGLESESLQFKQILVNGGPRLKRVDRFHGARFNSGMISRQMSHLKIIVVGTKENDGT